MTIVRQRRPQRRAGALAAGTVLALLGALAASPAFAAAGQLAEGFDGAAGQQAPNDWSVSSRNTAGMQAGWLGWSFHTAAEVTQKFGNSGDRGSFARAQGMTAVVHSDSNRPTSGTFDSTLWAPELALTNHSGAVKVAFDSHYKQGQAAQTAQLVARFDGGAEVPVEKFTANRLNQAVTVTFDAPVDANTVQLGWSYMQSSNNWFWMIDNVQISEAAPAPVAVTVLSAQKPVAAAGGTVPVNLGGLRPGQQAIVTVGGTPVASVPAADANGTTAFSVPISASQAPGFVELAIAGEGIAPATLSITVLAASGAKYSTSEERVWFNGFDADAAGWAENTGWALSTRDQIVAQYGTDRRQAFTRGSATIAVADAAGGPLAATLRSAPIAVKGGDKLEVRVDSHYRDRSAAQSGSVTAVFNTGQTVKLREFASGSGDEESAQLRLPASVPAGAKTMTLEFAFETTAAAGSWMIDDVQVVRPLAALPANTSANAVVDIFSDVQGATTQLRDRVLPGFRSMSELSNVIVSNGDLVAQGTTANYASYLAAFNAGGGTSYDTSISVIGNHEYYGSDGSNTFKNRFLDTTQMRNVGGQGGLWGEVLVDGELPLLWVGSEAYEYSQKTGSGPFMDISDTQFAWLRDRLAYWKEQNSPVLLMSHHVIPNSVSGSYARFYKNDYGNEEQRFTALLQNNPNVIAFTSHTHWSPLLNDWSVEQRFDPTAASAPTVVNTGAVTTMYGPSGDWEERAVGGADPVGIRAALYDDRVRVTMYSFTANGPQELKHIDVATPVEPSEPPVEPTTPPVKPTDPPVTPTTPPVKPTDPPVTPTTPPVTPTDPPVTPTTPPVKPTDPPVTPTTPPGAGAVTLANSSSVVGGAVSLSGSGFAPGIELAFELRSTPVRLGSVITSSSGSFEAALTIPKNTPAGAHTLAVILPDGSEIVRAASKDIGRAHG